MQLDLALRLTWSGGHVWLLWQSQPLTLLASWLGTHARRDSMSSCDILWVELQYYVFFLCKLNRRYSRTIDFLIAGKLDKTFLGERRNKYDEFHW